MKKKLLELKNKELKTLVNDAIFVYMSEGFAFTSVDICNHIRDQYPDKFIKYRDVTKLVKKMTLVLAQENSYQYNATLQSIDNGSATLAYLYHDKDFSPEDYLARDQITLKTL